MGARAVKTCLVGGFLGAGKTTFILDQVKKAGSHVVVLVNEFGDLGIDGVLIREKGGIDVVELPGGCICCSQKEGLLENVRRIAGQFSPELLLIEPSGVAETSELLQVLHDGSLSGVIQLDSVITILDAVTFLDFSEPEAFGLFFLDQVKSADLVLINKADLVSPEVLDRIEERIGLLNPSALTVCTEFCRTEVMASPAFPERQPERMLRQWGLRVESLSIVPHPLSESKLTRFLGELECGTFGRILRGKGFIEVENKGLVNLQLVGKNVRAETLTCKASPRLTLLGFELNREAVREFFL